MSDERANKCEIQPTPKDMSCRSGRHGPKDYAPYPENFTTGVVE